MEDGMVEDERTNASRERWQRASPASSSFPPPPLHSSSVLPLRRLPWGGDSPWCMVQWRLPAVLSPRPQGASLATWLLRQIGGGASAVEIPCNAPRLAAALAHVGTEGWRRGDGGDAVEERAGGTCETAFAAVEKEHILSKPEMDELYLAESL